MSMINTKPFVFVIMPFDSDFDDVYHLGIKSACQTVNAYCERVDEQIFRENILDRVYNQISKADILVAEMTGRNPNVFYEAGYAHALNKQVIFLTKNADDIPFDLKHYPHIVYGGKITKLKTELEKRLKWYIKNPGKIALKVDSSFEFVFNGNTWKEGLEIDIPCDIEWHDKYGGVVKSTSPKAHIETGNLLFSLQVGIHNISDTVIENARYRLGIVVPRFFSVIKRNSDIETVTLQGENLIVKLFAHRTLFPDDWNSSNINFSLKRQDLPNTPIDLTFRLFSELGTKDYKFKAKLVLDDVW